MEGFSVREISLTSWFLCAVWLDSKMEGLWNLHFKVLEIEKHDLLHACLLFNVRTTLRISNIHFHALLKSVLV